MRTSRALTLALMTAACGAHGAAPQDAGTRSDSASNDAAALRVDAFVPHVETRSIGIGPFHVASGVEQTLCVALDLGNEQPMMLRGVHTHITEGSHHLVVSRATGTPVDATPTPCAPLSHGIDQSIFIAESREGNLSYPSYAGLPMAAHQVIGLELHMIDLAPGPLDIAGMVDFDLVPADPNLREVQILFTGPFALHLPPHVDTTVVSTTPMTPGVEVLAMTTHTHQLGIDATLDVTPDVALPGTRVHESLSWSDPPLTTFDPPLVIGPTDSVRLTCVFRNTTDATVSFGTRFDAEMCFFWAYFLDPI